MPASTASPTKTSSTPPVTPCELCRGADRVLLIGADHDGRLLEIVVLDPDDDPVVIHAQPLRPKFYPYLQER